MKNVVVIPTYNEKGNVVRLIPEIFKLLPDIFVMVVDDNSPDGTAGAVLEMKKAFPNLSILSREKKEGLGKAYTHAFSELLKDKEIQRVVMMDADLSHDPKYLPEMLRESAKHSLVIGSRYIKGGGTVGWELWRRILSFGGNIYCRLVTGMPVTDCTGGFNIISAELLRKVDLSNIDVSGYAFILEIKYLLWRAGAIIKEIPIVFQNRTGGESKISGHIISEGIIAPWKMIFKRFRRPKPDCPACSAKITEFFTNKNSYDLYRCKNCRSIFVWPLPDDSSKLYSADYFSGATGGYGYVNYDQDKAAMSEIFEKYLDKIERMSPEKGKLLDIGAATGYFLDLAKKRGWQVAGVEISEHAAGIGRQKGLDIKTGAIENADFPSASFEAATLWDVIEHLPDPKKTLKHCHRILKSDGLIAINTPDAGSLTAKILGKHWPLLVPPEHLIVFSKKALTSLLAENGFRVLVVAKIAKRFALQYIFQILSNGSKFFLWKWLAKLTQNNCLGKISVPLKLNDNVFIIAVKS